MRDRRGWGVVPEPDELYIEEFDGAVRTTDLSPPQTVELRRAVEREEWEVFYQPFLCLRTGTITGFEALVRWRHPSRGMLGPSEFIPLAEKTGLICPIGEWVLNKACSQGRRMQEAGFGPLRVSVNLSVRQLAGAELAGTVARAVVQHCLDPRSLQLELTETVAIEDVASASETLRSLSVMGVGISLDDFGTGHSALQYLSEFPITTIKISQALIRNLHSKPELAVLARSVIRIANELKLDTVAEGVEAEEELAFLCAAGCDEIQGYLVSRPVPADEIGRQLQLAHSIVLASRHALAPAA